VACLTKRTCVDHCRTECMGAPTHNAAKNVCEPETSAEEEHIDYAFDHSHKKAFTDNFVSSTPKISTKTDDAYYLENEESQPQRYREKDDLLGLQLNSKKVITGAIRDMAEACQGLKDSEDADMSCHFTESGEHGHCECEFKEKQSCTTWFADEKQLKYVVEDSGTLVFTGDQCECPAAKVDGMFQCKFGLKPDIPKLKADKNDAAALSLAGGKEAFCQPNKCDTAMQAKMPGAVGTVVNFGSHHCGYSYTGDAGDFYCDSKCNCHQEVDEEDAGKGMLEDDDCTEQICDGMSKCSPLNYGSYGCGYSCEDTDGDFYFCSQDCDCESDE